MKIIHKTNNYKGAKALLFGLKELSTYDITITLEELKNYQDKEIYLSLDKNMFNEDLSYLTKILTNIDKYNIKGIFFYDLAVLNIANKLNIKTPLIWNQNFLVTNYKTINFYAKDNIKGAVLSSEITINEIEEIAQNTKINYMIEKNNKYPIIENETCTKFLTKDILNGIKYINKLKEIGIKYIILDNTLIENKQYEKIAKIYEEAVNNNLSEKELLTKEKEIKNIISGTDTLFLNKKTIYKVKRKW